MQPTQPFIMKKIILLTVITLCFLHVAYSQDGKIIEQTEYNYPDSVIVQVESIIPGVRADVEKTKFYRITYLSDGLKVKGYLAIPKQAGKYPCIIYNRGGSREFSAINDRTFLRWTGKMAGAGYVVVASQYRGNAGGEGKEEFGGKDLNDVLNLMPLLSSVKEADTSRIGMFGLSRGGMMTFLALTKTTRIKAAVILSGLADLPQAREARPEIDSVWSLMIPDYYTKRDEVLKARSATQFADKMYKSTPILIVQGTGDWRVPAGQVIDLAKILYEVKHPFRFILYEGAQHSMIEYIQEFYAQTVNWYNDYLRDGKKWPDLKPHGE
jgi:dipeptidyl aminopeptidase/acylaminoacyl peptidase